MSTNYFVMLMDCSGITNTDRREAESIFCDAIEAFLGGADKVAPAYLAYDAAFAAHGELPLPAAATDSERDAVNLWEEAERIGAIAAFAGWHNPDSAAHFEISCSPE